MKFVQREGKMGDIGSVNIYARKRSYEINPKYRSHTLRGESQVEAVKYVKNNKFWPWQFEKDSKVLDAIEKYRDVLEHVTFGTPYEQSSIKDRVTEEEYGELQMLVITKAWCMEAGYEPSYIAFFEELFKRLQNTGNLKNVNYNQYKDNFDDLMANPATFNLVLDIYCESPVASGDRYLTPEEETFIRNVINNPESNPEQAQFIRDNMREWFVNKGGYVSVGSNHAIAVYMDILTTAFRCQTYEEIRTTLTTEWFYDRGYIMSPEAKNGIIGGGNRGFYTDVPGYLKGIINGRIATITLDIENYSEEKILVDAGDEGAINRKTLASAVQTCPIIQFPIEVLPSKNYRDDNFYKANFDVFVSDRDSFRELVELFVNSPVRVNGGMLSEPEKDRIRSLLLDAPRTAESSVATREKVMELVKYWYEEKGGFRKFAENDLKKHDTYVDFRGANGEYARLPASQVRELEQYSIDDLYCVVNTVADIFVTNLPNMESAERWSVAMYSAYKDFLSPVKPDIMDNVFRKGVVTYVGPRYDKGVDPSGNDVSTNITVEEVCDFYNMCGIDGGNKLSIPELEKYIASLDISLRNLENVLGLRFDFEKKIFFSFGASGHGSSLGYMVMQKGNERVISLNRDRGIGVWGHEFAHAWIDSILGEKIGKLCGIDMTAGKNENKMLTRAFDYLIDDTIALLSPTHDSSVEALKRLQTSFPKTFTMLQMVCDPSSSVFLNEMHTNSLTLDSGKDVRRRSSEGAYWSTPTEMLARAAHCYFADKLAEHGWRDDFSNGNAYGSWSGHRNMGDEKHPIWENRAVIWSVPDSEREIVKEVFDGFFTEMKEMGLVKSAPEMDLRSWFQIRGTDFPIPTNTDGSLVLRPFNQNVYSVSDKKPVVENPKVTSVVIDARRLTHDEYEDVAASINTSSDISHFVSHVVVHRNESIVIPTQDAPQV